jgi:hypothetical protein
VLRRTPASRYHAAVTNPLRAKRNPFSIDAPLPPSGPRRYVAIAALVIGGAVALLVPVVFAVMLWGMLHGE